jgi:oleandomycin transport system ATP-binding protein
VDGLVTAPITDPAVMPAVVRRLDDDGVAIGELSLRKSSLDEVFFVLTGHRTDHAEDTGGATEEPIKEGSSA